MATAKDIIIKPIKAHTANALVKKVHYSGKVVQNSVLHFGVFLDGKLEGVMQFGSPMDKRKVLPLVKGTLWHEMLELNRMAFSDNLPKNSESRALSIVFRLIKKHYPHIKWILSFSDGTQCGDGAIYRASGFVLTQINPNKTLYQFPNGAKLATMTFLQHWDKGEAVKLCNDLNIPVKPYTISQWKAMGAKPLQGYQLRYIYFLDPKQEDNLTCPIIPFSKIDDMGAGMYKGQKISLQDRRVKELS